MKSVNTTLKVNTTLRALHHWSTPTQNRGYLKHPHAHDFKVEMEVPVYGHDRELEFHDLQRDLHLHLMEMSQGSVDDWSIHDFGSMSCEMIALEVLEAFPEASSVSVFEDNTAGATVSRVKSELDSLNRLLDRPGFMDYVEGKFRQQQQDNPEFPGPLFDDGSKLGVHKLNDVSVLSVDAAFSKDYTRVYRHRRPEVVTICGSTRFKEETLQAIAEAEFKGFVALSVGSYMHADGYTLTDEQKQGFDELHKWKIAMSDAVLVINEDGYVGSSTRSEIEFARSIGVEVRWRFPGMIPEDLR